MKIYLLSVLRAANAEVLPFDWAATSDEFLDTIADYEKASNGLADLTPARRATEALKASSASLRGTCSAAQCGADGTIARAGSGELHKRTAVPS